MKFDDYIKESTPADNRSMEVALKKMTNAIDEVTTIWVDKDIDSELGGNTYPKYLPSMEDFAMDIRKWVEQSIKDLRK